jgi:GNAT superfamily N-acetyltransferase
MPLTFELLADRPDTIPVVAKWYFDEWRTFLGHDSVVETQAMLQEYMNRDRLPLMIVMADRAAVMGVAQLKIHELEEMFPDRKHWLGGVYVAPAHRGQGHGSVLVEEAAGIATGLGVPTLHLQTAELEGGLYARLGWMPVQSVNNGFEDVLVMERRLTD